MTDDFKKPYKFDVVVDPFAEFPGKVLKWAKEQKEIKAAFKPYKFAVDAMLDNRKWSKAKLTDELEGPAVWASKLLSVQATDAMKGDKSAIAELVKSYTKSAKEVAKAQSLRLEEIVADKGDNKKALKDGKAALAKIASLDIKSMFGDFAAEIEPYVKKLIKDFDRLGKDQKKDEVTGKIQTEAAKAVAEVKSAFDKTTKEAEGAVAFLLRKGKEIANNKNVAPELQAFGKEVLKSESIFDQFLKDVTAFEKLLDTASTEVSAKDPDVGRLRKLLADLGQTSGKDGNAATVLNTAKDLKKSFDKVAKDL